MPDVINIAPVSYCGQQATEVLIKPAFLTPELQRLMQIMLNIKSRKQLALDSILEDILQDGTGCGRTPSGDVINLSEKFLDVCDIKANLDQCAKNLRDSFMEEWLRSGNAINDITGTRVEDYILEKVQDALRIDVFKVVWFGDTNSTDETLSTCTGFWPRLIQSANAYGITKAGSFNAVLTECEALTAFRDMWTDQSPLLKSRAKNDKYIAVTSSVWENYRTCLEEKCCGDRGVIRTEEGDERLFFRGVEVIEMTEWDRIIAAKNLSFPHRALLTFKDNLVLGTDALAATNTLEILYNPYQKTNQIDAEFKMGTQFIYDELTIVTF